jgi:hypothetical protein
LNHIKILIENEFVKSWTDDESPIIFSRVLKEPQSSIMLQQFCDMQEGFIKEIAARKQGAVYSICDTYIMQPFTFQVLVNYYAHVFAKQQRAGLTFKAFVKPRNFERLTESNDIIKRIETRPIGMFESFDQAFYHIRNEWKQLQTRKVVAIL